MSDRVAVVTGASRGIGSAIADRLVADGCFVYATATSEQGAEAISARLGDKGKGVALDIGSDESVSHALEEFAAAEAPTILVNNAGITQDNLMLRMSDEEWSSVINTNLSGVFRLTKGLLRGMVKARWGRVVNVGSVVARMGNPGQANYVAAKSGVEGFARALALEVASRSITVNTVAPGFIETDMTRELTEQQTEAMLERIPANRMGTVEDVAAAVAFLCSEEAGYITGQTLQVNGGLYAA